MGTELTTRPKGKHATVRKSLEDLLRQYEGYERAEVEQLRKHSLAADGSRRKINSYKRRQKELRDAIAELS